MEGKNLTIGYIMQANAADMSKVSGPQLHVEAVVRGFKKRGHAVSMVAIQGDETLWTDDLVNWQPTAFGFSEFRLFRIVESVVRGVQSRLRLPFLRLFDSYRFSDACVSALKRCDILYERFGFLSYGGLIAAKRLQIPIIYEMNGDLVEEFAQVGLQLSKPQWAAIHFTTRQMFRYASHIIAVSEPLKQTIIRRWGVNPVKVTAVTNGVNLDVFLNQTEVERVRGRYLPNGAPTIVFVGSFQPWHGIDILVEAFGQVASLDGDSRLLLVGDGPVRADIESKVLNLTLEDRVIFTGMLPHRDVAALLSTSDVAVVNPRSSMMTKSQSPLKLFEYMAAGKAIVAPLIPEMQVLLTDRVNAILVPPNDQRALAGALLELLKNRELRGALGRSAKQQAIERHSWNHTVAQLESIMYRSLAPTGG